MPKKQQFKVLFWLIFCLTVVQFIYQFWPSIKSTNTNDPIMLIASFGGVFIIAGVIALIIDFLLRILFKSYRMASRENIKTESLKFIDSYFRKKGFYFESDVAIDGDIISNNNSQRLKILALIFGPVIVVCTLAWFFRYDFAISYVLLLVSLIGAYLLVDFLFVKLAIARGIRKGSKLTKLKIYTDYIMIFPENIRLNFLDIENISVQTYWTGVPSITDTYNISVTTRNGSKYKFIKTSSFFDLFQSFYFEELLKKLGFVKEEKNLNTALATTAIYHWH